MRNHGADLMTPPHYTEDEHKQQDLLWGGDVRTAISKHRGYPNPLLARNRLGAHKATHLFLIVHHTQNCSLDLHLCNNNVVSC